MKKKATAALTTAFAGVAVVVGLAGPASAGTPSTPNQRFNLAIQFDADRTTTSCTVVASGVIQGTGTCTIHDVSENVGRVRLVLPGGTVTLRVREVASTDDFDEARCVNRFTSTERFRIVNGTGAYAGASGSGTEVSGGIFTAPVTPQGCDFANGSGFVGVSATATVSLGGSGSA